MKVNHFLLFTLSMEGRPRLDNNVGDPLFCREATTIPLRQEHDDLIQCSNRNPLI